MTFLAIAVILLLVLFQLTAQIFAGIDVGRRRRVRGGNKWVWVWVILIGMLPGALTYLAFGRLEDDRKG